MPSLVKRINPSAVALGRVPAMARQMRNPSHSFYVRTAPWCIQPVAIAPVLPGDTMKNARIQARVVTDPVASKLLGWWTELHLFYVKHRDLDAFNGNTYYQDMVLSPSTGHASTSTVAGGGTATYRLNGRRDYVKDCLNCVTGWWFRGQDDLATEFTHPLNGLPLAALARKDWMDSLMRGSDYATTDFSADLDASGTVTGSEIEKSLELWQALQANQLTNMTYEDFLATYGVHQKPAEQHQPERIRSISEWTYPTNTVSQGTGAVSSACVWSIADRADKDRFFKEPGFLLLVSVTKPKVYRTRQPGAAVNLLDNAYLWLPAVLRDDPSTSLTTLDTVSGAVPSVAINNMMADMRDLFLYGDQFLAVTPSVSGGDSVAASAVWAAPAGNTAKFGAIPSVSSTTGRPDYPDGSLTERQALFAGTTNESMLVEIEGVLSLSIAGSIVDQSPGIPVRA